MKKSMQYKSVWIFLIGVVILGMIASSAAIGAAQTTKDELQIESLSNPPKIWILEGERVDNPIRNLPPREFLLNAPQTANITVTYVGSWDSAAQAAFEYAVSIWETQITSSVEIKVEAEWANLGPGVLGGAGTETVFRNFTNAPILNTWYPVALANKLAGSDLDPTGGDIGAAFSSAYTGWYFGTDGNPPGNKIDFVSVVLHEIGHGLGFAGSMTVGTNCGGSGIGCWGFGTGFPTVYDRFTENGSGTALLNFPNNSTQLGTQLTSNSVYFDGPNANAANGNTRVPLYAPATWQQGSSYSHLAESFNGTGNALMTYSIGPGEANHGPGPVMTGIFKDMGWSFTIATPTNTPLSPCPTLAFVTPVPGAAGDVFLPLVKRSFTDCLTLTPTNTPPGGPTPTEIPGWTTIINENFEGSFPGAGWNIFDFPGLGYQWAKRNCSPYQGAFAAWAAGGGSNGQNLGCGANYANNMETWMRYGPLDLATATEAEVNLKLSLTIELPDPPDYYDYFCYIASSVGGTDPLDYEGWCQVQPTIGWKDITLNLADIYNDGGSVDFTGDSSVWVAFEFYSDVSVNAPTGAIVDNIVIQKCSYDCGAEATTIQSNTSGIVPWSEISSSPPSK